MKLSLHHCVKTGIPALVVLLIALPLAITFAAPVAAVDTTAPQSTAQTTVVAEPALLTAQTGEDMAYNPLCGCESPFPRPPHDFTSPGGYYYHYTGTRCSLTTDTWSYTTTMCIETTGYRSARQRI